MNQQIEIERLTDGVTSVPLWTAVREICCRTGNDGAAIPAERWEIFGRIWIEPYRLLASDWTYVAFANGAAVGYLTGCPDTVSFARRHFIHCALPLIGQSVFGRYRHDGYGRRFARQALWLERSALRSFPWALRRALPRSHPAHLHMNVDADYRRSGVGTHLLQRYCDDLRRAGIPAVHLFCGAAPVPFYRRNGFRELAAVAVRGHPVHAMALDL